VLLEGLLDSLFGGVAYSLVDPECPRQVPGRFTRVAVQEAGPAKSFQGAPFLAGSTEVAHDGQRMSVMLAGLVGSRSPGCQLTETVQRLSLAEVVAEVTEQYQGPLVASGRSREVAGLLLQYT
jgi:hypothetical protein